MANTDILAEICTAEATLQAARAQGDGDTVARLEGAVAALWRRRREDLARCRAYTHLEPADAWAPRRIRR